MHDNKVIGDGMPKQLVYLASPYSGDDALIEQRYEEAVRVTGALAKKGIVVYSPICHNHVLCQKQGLARSWARWSEFDKRMIDACTELWALKIAGWEDSIGVSDEIEYTKLQGKRVAGLDPDSLEVTEIFPALQVTPVAPVLPPYVAEVLVAAREVLRTANDRAQEKLRHAVNMLEIKPTIHFMLGWADVYDNDGCEVDRCVEVGYLNSCSGGYRTRPVCVCWQDEVK